MMMINEATLEARLHQVLETVFPSFKEMNIVHQQSFSIKFGHHNVKVDLKNPSRYPNRAIFDMLLKCGDTNIMLVELKREGLELDEEDVSQGLSYARLIKDMPPLLLVSNGKENLLFDTYTMKELDENSVDMDFVLSRIKNTFELSLTAFKNAVNFLLNRQPELIGKVIRKISHDHLQYQCGKVNELDKPICPEFQVSRNIVNRIYKTIKKKGGVIGLIGQAYSGKTCILYQMFRNYGFIKDHYILYIDLKDHNFSIFQQLAQGFSRETRDNITKEKIRDWFSTMLFTDAKTRFILLVDNLNNEVSEELTSEFLELINLFNDSNHSIVYTIDEWTYKHIAYKKSRNYKTIIGNVTKEFYVKELNDREFLKVNKRLFYCSNTVIQYGGHFCSEFRQPRVLRNIAASYNDIDPPLEGAFTQVYPVPNFELINNIVSNIIFTKDTHEVYKKLAAAYFADSPLRKNIPELNIVAMNLGGISTASIVKHLGVQEHERIIMSGLVSEREYRKDLNIIIPKVPELFIFYAIDFAFHFLREHIGKKPLKEIYDLYLETCSQYPSADIIGSEVLKRIGYIDVDLYTFLIMELIKVKPDEQPISKGTRALVFSETKGYIHIEFNVDMEDKSFISEHLPYSILSQFLDVPIKSEDHEGIVDYRYFLHLLYELGSTPKFIYRMGFGSFDTIRPFIQQPLPQTGMFLSGKNGVIEALVQSYQKCFVAIPEIMETLFEKAKAEKNYQVIWRVYLATRTFTDTADSKLAERANALQSGTIEEIFKRMDETTGLNTTESYLRKKGYKM